MFKWKKDPDIEYCYEKFRTAPIGSWSHAVGSFSMVMDEQWEFNADHTGKITTHTGGPFNSMRGEITFIWREVADYTIQCKIISENYFDDANDEDSVDEIDTENNEVFTENETTRVNEELHEYWETIRYGFKRVPTDVGELKAMCEIDEEGNFLNRFWISNEPLNPHNCFIPSNEPTVSVQELNQTIESLNEPKQLTNFIKFPKLCDIAGCFGMVGLLAELKDIFPMILAFLIVLVPITIFVVAVDREMSNHPLWKKFCDEGPLFAARWYLAVTGCVILLILSGNNHPKGWVLMLVFIIIGCYEPVKIVYERYKHEK
jgi:hypothetical protein